MKHAGAWIGAAGVVLAGSGVFLYHKVQTIISKGLNSKALAAAQRYLADYRYLIYGGIVIAVIGFILMFAPEKKQREEDFEE